MIRRASIVAGAFAATVAGAAAAGPPSVLIVTVDTLRADRMSCYGYTRPTTPRLDALIGSGARFTQARTVEPLTAPALASMLTSRQPHDSGATRNGLRLRPGMVSLPKLLQARGYRTAAFVSNWTLRHKLSGLAEHFETYREVLTRKRWGGLVSSEAGGADVNREVESWLSEHGGDTPDRPFLIWAHYIEPHAPYRLHAEHLAALGIARRGSVGAHERYDTEVAEVDRLAGQLVERIRALVPASDLLVVFTADHGESLGEHEYWGHGRHLDETTLHVPMALVWPGRIRARTIDASALNLDLAPTIAGLLGLARPPDFEGYDWTAVLGGATPPVGRVTQHQTHRGVVYSGHDSNGSRRCGLLEVAVIQDRRKEVLRLTSGRHRIFDLRTDPLEHHSLAGPRTRASEALLEWVEVVRRGLNRSDEVQPVPVLDGETARRLRALGYAE